MLDARVSPVDAFKRFQRVAQRDASFRAGFDWSASWRHLEKRLSEGALADMGFAGFDGAPLIGRMLHWIDKFPYPCSINDDRIGSIAATVRAADKLAVEALGLDPGDYDLAAIARYTAQDIFFQTLAVPNCMADGPRHVLDFGAGHGRLLPHWVRGSHMAYAVDATPGPYLAQALWTRAHGLPVNDYIDIEDGFQARPGALNHLPAWRLDLIPSGSLDMITAVQVLRELSKPMLASAMAEFARLLRPGGRLYIRDHIGFHNVNAVDLDALLTASGFVLEWRPHLVDRQDIHGLPRIWRRADPKVILGGLP